MPEDAEEHRDRPAALATLTAQLPDADPADTAAALGLVWDGLALARGCGLDAATAAPVWKSRHDNAQACEYDAAAQLASAPSLPQQRLALPAGVTTAIDEAASAAAVAAIQAFTTAAIELARVAGAHAEVWPDKRALLGVIAYLRSLGDCWSGLHTSYSLVLPDRRPPWWPASSTRPGTRRALELG